MTEKTLADRALSLVRGDILAGRLPPEARLKLGELQKRYGLGLSPLREGLMRLAAEGHVVAEGQKGFRVAPVSAEDLADLTRARMDIETLALTSSIERGGADWEAGLVAALHLLSRAPLPRSTSERAQASEWEARHRDFHLALVAACGSQWIKRMQAQLMDHSERYRRVRLFHSVPRRQLARNVEAEHRAIVEAALARDAAKACRLLREHLKRTADVVASYWEKPGAATRRTKN
jgi:DNA-binding GntR family transcriptional regulator